MRNFFINLIGCLGVILIAGVFSVVTVIGFMNYKPENLTSDNHHAKIPVTKIIDGHLYDEVKIYDSLWGGHYRGEVHSPNCQCRIQKVVK